MSEEVTEKDDETLNAGTGLLQNEGDADDLDDRLLDEPDEIAQSNTSKTESNEAKNDENSKNAGDKTEVSVEKPDGQMIGSVQVDGQDWQVRQIKSEGSEDIVRVTDSANVSDTSDEEENTVLDLTSKKLDSVDIEGVKKEISDPVESSESKHKIGPKGKDKKEEQDKCDDAKLKEGSSYVLTTANDDLEINMYMYAQKIKEDRRCRILAEMEVERIKKEKEEREKLEKEERDKKEKEKKDEQDCIAAEQRKQDENSSVENKTKIKGFSKKPSKLPKRTARIDNVEEEKPKDIVVVESDKKQDIVDITFSPKKSIKKEKLPRRRPTKKNQTVVPGKYVETQVTLIELLSSEEDDVKQEPPSQMNAIEDEDGDDKPVEVKIEKPDDFDQTQQSSQADQVGGSKSKGTDKSSDDGAGEGEPEVVLSGTSEPRDGTTAQRAIVLGEPVLTVNRRRLSRRRHHSKSSQTHDSSFVVFQEMDSGNLVPVRGEVHEKSISAKPKITNKSQQTDKIHTKIQREAEQQTDPPGAGVELNQSASTTLPNSMTLVFDKQHITFPMPIWLAFILHVIKDFNTYQHDPRTQPTCARCNSSIQDAVASTSGTQPQTSNISNTPNKKPDEKGNSPKSDRKRKVDSAGESKVTPGDSKKLKSSSKVQQSPKKTEDKSTKSCHVPTELQVNIDAASSNQTQVTKVTSQEPKQLPQSHSTQISVTAQMHDLSAVSQSRTSDVVTTSALTNMTQNTTVTGTVDSTTAFVNQDSSYVMNTQQQMPPANAPFMLQHSTPQHPICTQPANSPFMNPNIQTSIAQQSVQPLQVGSQYSAHAMDTSVQPSVQQIPTMAQQYQQTVPHQQPIQMGVSTQHHAEVSGGVFHSHTHTPIVATIPSGGTQQQQISTPHIVDQTNMYSVVQQPQQSAIVWNPSTDSASSSASQVGPVEVMDTSGSVSAAKLIPNAQIVNVVMADGSIVRKVLQQMDDGRLVEVPNVENYVIMQQRVPYDQLTEKERQELLVQNKFSIAKKPETVPKPNPRKRKPVSTPRSSKVTSTPKQHVPNINNPFGYSEDFLAEQTAALQSFKDIGPARNRVVSAAVGKPPQNMEEDDNNFEVDITEDIDFEQRQEDGHIPLASKFSSLDIQSPISGIASSGSQAVSSTSSSQNTRMTRRSMSTPIQAKPITQDPGGPLIGGMKGDGDMNFNTKAVASRTRTTTSRRRASSTVANPDEPIVDEDELYGEDDPLDQNVSQSESDVTNASMSLHLDTSQASNTSTPKSQKSVTFGKVTEVGPCTTLPQSGGPGSKKPFVTINAQPTTTKTKQDIKSNMTKKKGKVQEKARTVGLSKSVKTVPPEYVFYNKQRENLARVKSILDNSTTKLQDSDITQLIQPFRRVAINPKKDGSSLFYAVVKQTDRVTGGKELRNEVIKHMSDNRLKYEHLICKHSEYTFYDYLNRITQPSAPYDEILVIACADYLQRNLTILSREGIWKFDEKENHDIVVVLSTRNSVYATREAVRDSDQHLKKSSSSPTLKLKCWRCKKVFSSLTILTAHMKLHKSQRYPCPQCSKVYAANSTLKQHISVSHNGEPYKCDVENCGKIFYTFQSFKDHKKVHELKFNYTCHLCGHGYMRKDQFDVHILRHTQTRPFTCDKCNRKFFRKQELSRHLKISCYNPDRPKVKCNLCGQLLKNNDSYRNHRNHVHGEGNQYKCPHCDLLVSYHSTSIKRHLISCHKDKMP